MNLNTSQYNAVTCPLGPTLVIAGPGSGKTHVIINRINYMIEHLGCEAHHILVVTFSKMAAEEMKERFLHRFGAKPVHFGTLHSVFYRILRRSDPRRYHIDQLLVDDKRKYILQGLISKLELDENEDFLNDFLKHLSLMKNQLESLNTYEPKGIARVAFQKLYRAYEDYKERHGLFDFDDMLVECYHLLLNEPSILAAARSQYRYILIDEFQDVNKVQFEIIKLLAGKSQYLFVVGDDDQSIYQFRGAKPEFLLDFEKHFPGTSVILLDINYRSTKQILSYSMALIANNKHRFEKALSTPHELGQAPQIIHCKDAKEEAHYIMKQISELKQKGLPLEEIAVIYRTNIQARSVVEMLLTANIPFALRDGMVSLYDQWLTQDILAYLHLAQNINQPQLALRIMNKPKRYISKAILETATNSSEHLFMHLLGSEQLTEWQKNYIQQLLFDLQVIKEKPLGEAIGYIRRQIGYDDYVADYAAFRRMPVSNLLEVLDEIEDSAKNFAAVDEWEAFLMEMARKVKEQSQSRVQDAITLTTMHGAKGLEYHTVFVLDVVDGTVPHHKSPSPEEIEEERRLFYVAVTRAKKMLYLMVPSERYGKPVSRSPFLDEVDAGFMKSYLKIGASVTHKRLGKGTIKRIIDSYLLEVAFENGQMRKIDAKYCLSHGILKLE